MDFRHALKYLRQVNEAQIFCIRFEDRGLYYLALWKKERVKFNNVRRRPKGHSEGIAEPHVIMLKSMEVAPGPAR